MESGDDCLLHRAKIRELLWSRGVSICFNAICAERTITLSTVGIKQRFVFQYLSKEDRQKVGPKKLVIDEYQRQKGNWIFSGRARSFNCVHHYSPNMMEECYLHAT